MGPKVNSFFQRVYELVAKIPEGKVATYGMIAALLGEPRNGRVVGWAMRATPGHLRLPAHRVIYSNGMLAPEDVFGAKEMQRALLASEGVTFHEDGRVNLEKHLWDGS